MGHQQDVIVGVDGLMPCLKLEEMTPFVMTYQYHCNPYVDIRPCVVDRQTLDEATFPIQVPFSRSRPVAFPLLGDKSRDTQSAILQLQRGSYISAAAFAFASRPPIPCPSIHQVLFETGTSNSAAAAAKPPTWLLLPASVASPHFWLKHPTFLLVHFGLQGCSSIRFVERDTSFVCFSCPVANLVLVSNLPAANCTAVNRRSPSPP